MGLTEWFLLIVVVILIPLAIAVTVTLWSLEQARRRSKRHRPGVARRRVALPTPEGEDGGGEAPAARPDV